MLRINQELGCLILLNHWTCQVQNVECCQETLQTNPAQNYDWDQKDINQLSEASIRQETTKVEDETLSDRAPENTTKQNSSVLSGKHLQNWYVFMINLSFKIEYYL